MLDNWIMYTKMAISADIPYALSLHLESLRVFIVRTPNLLVTGSLYF